MTEQAPDPTLLGLRQEHFHVFWINLDRSNVENFGARTGVCQNKEQQDDAMLEPQPVLMSVLML